MYSLPKIEKKMWCRKNVDKDIVTYLRIQCKCNPCYKLKHAVTFTVYLPRSTVRENIFYVAIFYI